MYSMEIVQYKYQKVVVFTGPCGHVQTFCYNCPGFHKFQSTIKEFPSLLSNRECEYCGTFLLGIQNMIENQHKRILYYRMKETKYLIRNNGD